MSAMSVTARRTFARLTGFATTPLILAGFLAVTSIAFALRLDGAEGSRQTLATLWATSLAPFLPILAAFLGMGGWSEDRQTGRIDLLLTLPIHERDYVAGKMLGLFAPLVLAIFMSLALVLVALAHFAPSALCGCVATSFLPALAILLLQGAAWCALTLAFSAMTRRSFVAAIVSIFMLSVIPRALWAGALFWATAERTAFGEFPLDAEVFDFSTGVISTAVICMYVALICLGLFVATRSVVLLRFIGRHSRMRRVSSVISILLSVVLAASVSMLAFRTDVSFDLPIGSTTAFSPRLRHILTETSGHVTVTAFLPRKDARFRPLAYFLRTLQREAISASGLEISVRYVDPHWDIGQAEKYARQGVKEGSLVFEQGHRIAFNPLDNAADERSVASLIQSVTTPPQRREILWTTGHGEIAFDAYDQAGMSDIARELVMNGYRNRPFDLAQESAISSECALIVIAGARTPFSRTEINRLDTYLKGGGRLLVLLGSNEDGGIVSLLSSWGVRTRMEALKGARTLSGHDVIVSDFSKHIITSDLIGSRVIFENPLSFSSSATVHAGEAADMMKFISLARVGSATVIAAVERGGGTGQDLALRPTRLVVIGDPLFATNGILAMRANANRDLFLNATAFLSGTDASGAPATDFNGLTTGLDRTSRRHLSIAIALILPCLAYFLLSLPVFFRRRRS